MIVATPSTPRIELRPYQREAVDQVYAHLRGRDDNPCVVIPTGGGKTPVIATICRDAVTQWNGRVVILAHVKELLEQTAEKLRFIAPDLPVGIYSAGLRRKDLGYSATVAGIQSIWKKACDLGPVDLIIVDEAHMVPHVVLSRPRAALVGRRARPAAGAATDRRLRIQCAVIHAVRAGRHGAADERRRHAGRRSADGPAARGRPHDRPRALVRREPEADGYSGLMPSATISGITTDFRYS